MARILPFCLLWLFVACVSICSMHVEENGSSEERERSMNAFRVLPQEDECGIDEGQRNLLIERHSGSH